MPVFRFGKQKLGQGFSDFLSKESKNITTIDERKPAPFRRTYAIILCFLAFIVLTGRLYYLTIVKGAYFRNLSENNRLREERIEAPRGVIYDRNGVVLARNKPIHKICEKKDGKTSCHHLSFEKALELEAKGQKILLSLGREYPEASNSAHLAGYMRETTKEEIESGDYTYGDWIGAVGAEQTFEERLRGRHGKRLIEVDAFENEVSELGRVEPKPGDNIYLSTDANLQEKSLELLKGQKAVLIISDPKTGEILALVSSPSFDPNLFADFNEVQVSQVLNDPREPLFNRAISGTYPPGSTFKIITAAAGLETGKIDENTRILDTGIIHVGQFSFSNWYYSLYGKTEGEIGIVRAIARSNDIFFYKLGEMVGEEKLVEWAKRFKMGTKSGIELNGEAEGLIREQRKLYLGDLYHLSIGQGDLSATPLQVNNWTRIIANRGKYCKPTIIKDQRSKIKDQRSEVGSWKLEVGSEIDCEDLRISEKTIDLITKGMREACSPGGAAFPLFKFQILNSKLQRDNKNYLDAGDGKIEIPIACKTGTAEFGDEDKTHAWLTAFVPIADPEMVITVLVEGGGQGSEVGGKIVKELLEYYYDISGS